MGRWERPRQRNAFDFWSSEWYATARLASRNPRGLYEYGGI